MVETAVAEVGAGARASDPPGVAVKTLASAMLFIEARRDLIAAGLPAVSYEEAKRAFFRSINLGTRASLGESNRANARANSTRLKVDPGITSLIRAHAGEPVFLVAAGPSLNWNLEELRRVAGRWPIVAADAALPILDRAGIDPDYAVLVDTKPGQGRFWRDRPAGSKTKLLAAYCAHPDAVSAWPGDVLWFNTWGSDEDHAFQLEVGRDLGSLGVGGNVSTAMLWLAITTLYADPVVLVGHDFSYPRIEQYYADGGATEMAATTKMRLSTLDIYGDRVQTDLSLWSYSEWTEEWLENLFKDLADTGRRWRVVNATEGGVLGVRRDGSLRTDLMSFRRLAEVIEDLDAGRVVYGGISESASETPTEAAEAQERNAPAPAAESAVAVGQCAEMEA